MYIYVPDWLIVFLLATLITLIFKVLSARYFSQHKEELAVVYIVVMLAIAFICAIVADTIPVLGYVTGVTWLSAFETTVLNFHA